MGGARIFLAWAWERERSAALWLGVAVAVLAGCGPAFALSEASGLATVHPVALRQNATISLSAGTYSLDQDPDASNFPVRPRDVSISGPIGNARVQFTGYNQTPADVGGLLLGVGDDVQAARFVVHQPGTYRVYVADPAAGSRLFISETFGASAERAGGWALASLAALATIAVTSARMWRRRRRARQHPAGAAGR